MKPYKYLCIFLLIFVVGIENAKSQTQSVVYTYDNAGNRTKRTKIIKLSSSLKSQTGNSDKEEFAAAEIPIFEDVLSETKITIYPNRLHAKIEV